MLNKPQVEYGDLSIVIPAFNEAEGIELTLQSLAAEVAGAEIIVVDDHSQDATSKIAAGFAGTRIVRHHFNRGQGAALKTGMRLASRRYVAWFDADNQHRVSDLKALYVRMKGEHLVAVIGQRTSRSATLTRGVGKAVIRLIGRSLNVRTGSDLNCGLRIFQREVILGYMPLIPDRFSASLVSTLIMLERGYPIAFEAVETNPRLAGSTVRLRDGFDAVLQLVRAILLFAPLRFFLPIGLASLGLGALYSILIAAIRGLGLPVAGMFLMVMGVLVIMLGLLGDQISQMRLSQISRPLYHDEENKDEALT